MRRYFINERGYTLLITLGILMMLTMFLFSFTKIAVSQKNQVEKTDSSIVTTSLAEMGAEYYEKLFIDQITFKVNYVIEQMQIIDASNLTIPNKQIAYTNLMNQVNEDLLSYYRQMEFEETASDYAAMDSSKLTFVRQGVGYRLASLSAYNPLTKEIKLQLIGFSGGEESNPLEIRMTLPEKLMWMNDEVKTEETTYTFVEYSSFTSTDITKYPDQLISKNSYTFHRNQFYYFEEGAIFEHHQKEELKEDDTQGTSLTDVFILSNNTLEFQKQLLIERSYIIGKAIDINFTSNAQATIRNSTIVAETLDIAKTSNGGSTAQLVDLDDSKICLRSNVFETVGSDEASVNTMEESRFNTLLYNLQFLNDSYLVREMADGFKKYTKLNGTVVSTQATPDEVATACNLLKAATVEVNVFENYNPEKVQISHIVYP